ncbi:MAG: cobalamin biosynthesis protein, partial [Proteobacteria bacterium]|nr:cobalamin biosynthesis protein [Pseudomonadota bacterium]
VPGVTSVVAAPAYAGIPLTHRDHSSSVGIVTGHPVQKMSNISWESLVGLDTLIILMGVRNLPEIVNHLIEHKRSKDTPIAIIQDATLYTQNVLIGTLGDILQKARKSEIRPPCIIIIGEVVKLRKKLDWFKKVPREREVAAELRAGAKKEIRKNRPAIIAITERGLTLARKIQGLLGKADLFIPPALAARGSDSVQVYQNSLKELVAGLFTTYRALIFIMACGIVVRVIAPYLKDKHTDPAVVVVDEGGNFSISLLSGHEGGANNWAKKVASLIESRPVITTASEVFPRPSVVVGIGCHQGVSRQEVKEAIFESLKKAALSLKDVRNLATIANRKNEKGLIEFSQQYGIPVETFSLNQLKEVSFFSEPSKYALDVLGVKGVCEPVAMLSAQRNTLILKKIKWKNVTIAIAEVNSS